MPTNEDWKLAFREWVTLILNSIPDDESCPECHYILRSPTEGHAEDCRLLQALLKSMEP